MAGIFQIHAYGNQLGVFYTDKTRKLAQPTTGGAWIVDDKLKILESGNLLILIHADGRRQVAYPANSDVWVTEPLPDPDPDPEPPPPPPPPKPGGDRFVWPFDPRPASQGGSVSSEYGPRWGRVHQGIDFGFNGAVNGAPIPAAGVGRAMVRRNGGFGNHVILDHGNNIFTLYAHIQDGGVRVRDGQQVDQKQTVGLIGNTGNSFGAHLHWETHVGGLRWTNPGTHMNPRDFMARYAKR